MKPRVKRQRNGEVTVCVFKGNQREVTSAISNGQLQESLASIAHRLGVPHSSPAHDDHDIDLVDAGGFSVMGSLFHGQRYYLSLGESFTSRRLSTSCVAVSTASRPATDGLLDTSVVWAFDKRTLLHAPPTRDSPESPYRLEKTLLALQSTKRAHVMLPAELRASSACTSFATNEDTGEGTRPNSHAPVMLGARLASVEELLAFHCAGAYRDFLTHGTPLSNLPSDVYCCGAASRDAVRLSCGAVIDAGSLVLRSVVQERSRHTPAHPVAPLVSFCLVRPPGHHCDSERPKGFCLVNNVAVGAAQLLTETRMPNDCGVAGAATATAPLPRPRIAIIDLDVHFGEGTASFVDDYDSDGSVACAPRSSPTSASSPHPLLYLSLHRYDEGRFYPFDRRGASTYRGDRHPGCIVNVAVDTRAHHTAQCYQVISDHLMGRVMTRIFLPSLTRFRPDIVFVSLGFDAAYGDPLGRMAVEGGFAQAMSTLKEWCLYGPQTSAGRDDGSVVGTAGECAHPVGLVVVLEGGYSPDAVAKGVVGVAHALSFAPTDPDVRQYGRSRVPATWGDVRAREDRRRKETEQIRLESEAPSPPRQDGSDRSAVAVPADNDTQKSQACHIDSALLTDEYLMTKHIQWCEEVCDRCCAFVP